jgi:hypothetical protein
MTTKPKTFDCVEMKRKAQEEISAQWEARKEEFASYGAFLEATLLESDWGRRMWERLERKRAAP